jgi:hypothetical protein
MDTLGRKDAEKRVVAIEISAFVCIILIIWLNELIDIPHRLMGAEATPINWIESIFESSCIGVLGVLIIFFTRKVFQRIRHLEGMLPLCSFCKKIRDEEGGWHQIEAYISDKSEADFSHGICPECAEKFYPGMDLQSPGHSNGGS